MIKPLLISFILLLTFPNAFAQEKTASYFGKFYRDNQDNIIYLPQGGISFADTIVSYSCGFPKPNKEFDDPQQALGEPNYTKYLNPKYVSLGCAGKMVIQFKDNGFTDMPGKDLYFFEVGPSIEPFDVEISTDGKNWIRIGPLGGGYSSIDIASANTGERKIYYYVRITDLQSFCRGKTPGSDIDAVATVSGVFKISLNSDLLFDSGKYNLKEKSVNILHDLAKKIIEIGDAEILIQGHTDSVGTPSYNLSLSENRSQSVAEKLHFLLKEKGSYAYTTKAYGESKPTASNKTAAGKQKNRRVEIIVLPNMEFYKTPRKN